MAKRPAPPHHPFSMTLRDLVILVVSGAGGTSAGLLLVAGGTAWGQAVLGGFTAFAATVYFLDRVVVERR